MLENTPITIKKYANRRLYNTKTSSYVTLDDLAAMVKAGEQFLVFDAKSNEDITRSILGQIILDHENIEGQSLLNVNFLRQIISFYGDQMQGAVPHFLELSLSSFMQNQEQLQASMMKGFGLPNLPTGVAGNPFEEQIKTNMKMMEQAFSMFTPFKPPVVEEKKTSELDLLKQQMEAMQKMMEKMVKP
jgi:polyhydroxyalkanoate synthesis repressor PhaR